MVHDELQERIGVAREEHPGFNQMHDLIRRRNAHLADFFSGPDFGFRHASRTRPKEDEAVGFAGVFPEKYEVLGL